MIFSAKELHRLKRELDELTVSHIDIESRCVKAGLKAEFRRNRAEGLKTWVLWGLILNEINTDHGKLKALVDAVLSEPNNSDNKVLISFQNDLSHRNETRLQFISKQIAGGKCVLFLGPDILRVRRGGQLISFNELLCEKLETELEDNFRYYDERMKTDLNYMAQCYSEIPGYAPGGVQTIASEIFQKHAPMIDRPVFQKIAQLPVSLIINANADNLLCDEINNRTPNRCLFSFYNLSNENVSEEQEIEKQKKLDSENAIEAQKPSGSMILYNIFGTYQLDNTILYTESQFLRFIDRVIQGNPGLDSAIPTALNEMESYLFLGFDFNQWYFKVLFQLLKIKKVEDKAISCNVDNAVRYNIANKEFYEQEFKIYFIDIDVELFLDDVIHRVGQLQTNAPA
jgi:hypothetical protein